jgi:hypothetical protein
MLVNLRKVRTIDEIVDECETEMIGNKQFLVDRVREVRGMVEIKVRKLKRPLGDFGVEKSVLGNFKVFKSVRKA